MVQVTIDQETKKGAQPKQQDRYDPAAVKKLVIAISVAAGMDESDAAIFADALVAADLHGTSTHGISRLNIYIRRIQQGLINPSAKLKVEHRRSSTLVINANNGVGQVQAVKSLNMLMPLAEDTGIAVGTIRNSQHFGTLSYYGRRAAREDMILLAATNSEPSMAPTGSRDAYFGTNPLGASFPTTRGYPVNIDLATSLVARGNIISAQKRGEESIPPNWALNEDGEPTTDPAQALAGTMLPMARHKGYALALMVEIFSGVLSGAAIGPAIGSMYDDMDRSQDVGHFFCLLDISAFMDVAEFKRRLGRTIDEIKSSEKRPDVEEIFVPGEHSHRRAQKNRKRGILIKEPTQHELRALCEKLDIEFILK